MTIGKRISMTASRFAAGYLSGDSLSSYIMTDIPAQERTSTIRVVIELAMLGEDGGCAFGSGTGNRLFGHIYNNFYWDSTLGSTIRRTTVTVTDSERHLMDVTNNPFSISENGTTAAYSISSLSESFSGGVFWFFNNNPNVQTAGRYKIGRTRVSVDGTLYADFIPAVVGGEPGMYELTRGKHYTGVDVSFVADNGWGDGFD